MSGPLTGQSDTSLWQGVTYDLLHAQRGAIYTSAEYLRTHPAMQEILRREREKGATPMTAAEQVEQQVEEFIDGLAAEMYQQRSQSPREMTPERWASVKAKFPGSARSCREDVLRLHADDIEAHRADLILNTTTKEPSC